jgi:hypothetical protein
MANSYTLDSIISYLFCPLLYYLQEVKPKGYFDIELQEFTHALPGKSLKTALKLYNSGNYSSDSFPNLVSAVWGNWIQADLLDPAIIPLLERYETGRNQILFSFFEGRIKKSDGSHYVEPRASRAFNSMLTKAGIIDIPIKVEKLLAGKNKYQNSKLRILGDYKFAYAYADALLMAKRYKAPALNQIVGVNVPKVMDLAFGVKIKFNLDICLEKNIVETHDFSPLLVFNNRIARMDIRMLAAIYEQGEGKVVFRHFMSNRTLIRKAGRATRLIQTVSHVIRGIQAGIFIPQFLLGDDSKCVDCIAQNICLGKDQLLEHIFPGNVSWLEQ